MLRRLSDALFGRKSPLPEVFARVYRENLWLDPESRSGPGSTLERTAALRAELPGLLGRLGVRSLLDAACGDFNWIRSVELPIDRYVGVDVVPDLIARNRRLYAGGTRRFLVADVTSDPLPPCDAVLCRDALIHLSLADVERTLANFRRSGARLLLLTSHVGVGENVDIESGSWRNLNLGLPPFGFPDPAAAIVENPATGKILGAWELATLPDGTSSPYG